MGVILTFALGLLSVNESFAGSTELELAAIKQIESSNGTNVEHPVMKTGMHKGTRAGGHYGIMPLTAKELIKKNPKALAKYQYLLLKTNDEVTTELNTNEKLDKTLASIMWNKLRLKHSAPVAACAWFWGPSSPRCKASNVENLQYVEKFITAMNN